MRFGIKNFRLFDKEGSEFDLKPITLLTGANSSGKSSLAKAFLLLEDFLSQYSRTKDLGKCVLNFSSEQLRLCNFSSVLNRGSDTDNRIVFSYTKHSDFLNLDVKVSLFFKANPNDQEGKGHFDCCEIRSLEGVRIVTIQMKEKKVVDDPKDDGYKILIEPFYDVNLPYLRRVYLDRFRSNVRSDEREGIFFDLTDLDYFNNGDRFGEAHSNIICKQVYYNTLFLFQHIEDIQSFDDELFMKSRKRDGWVCYINKQTIATVDRLYKESGLLNITKFYSSLEEKSDLRYMGSFSMRGSVSPILSVAKKSEIAIIDGYSGLVEGKELNYIESDPFNYVLCVLCQLNLSNMNSEELEEAFFHRDILPSFKVFADYIRESIDDLLSFRFVNHIHYVPSDRVSVRRLYDFGNDQDSFHKLLKRYLAAKSDFLSLRAGEYEYYRPYPKSPSFRPGDFINKWLSRFEIGNYLQIETPAEGLGIILRLFSNENDNKGHLLADEGYGISQLVSLLLALEICIMDGYRDTGFAPRYILIVEEPETHLHPKYQSLLADLFWSALYDFRIRCIIETHSEYLIRKMQVIVSEYARNNKVTEEIMKEKCPVAVYYFPRNNRPYEMELRSDGKFRNEFGHGFFDEASNLVFEIL